MKHSLETYDIVQTNSIGETAKDFQRLPHMQHSPEGSSQKGRHCKREGCRASPSVNLPNMSTRPMQMRPYEQETQAATLRTALRAALRARPTLLRAPSCEPARPTHTASRNLARSTHVTARAPRNTETSQPTTQRKRQTPHDKPAQATQRQQRLRPPA